MKLPAPREGYLHLREMYLRADDVDKREALLAYWRYHDMMHAIGGKYGQPHYTVAAAFCALSPNNDYLGNLRSLVSVLDGMQEGVPAARITVSTYNHCKDRAISYLHGAPFDIPSRGLKIRSFYRNIIEPDCPRWVTVDGHVVAAYVGDDTMTMKDALVTKAQYQDISIVISALAAHNGVLPNQMQAAIWFARKRSLGVVYNPYRDMFADPADQWGTTVPVDEIKPYTPGKG